MFKPSVVPEVKITSSSSLFTKLAILFLTFCKSVFNWMPNLESAVRVDTQNFS
ncbi:Uncharacterised protein [Chlamydia trachomatis]|nr:Uncharacterised protein [Chlamydia trachomatis]